MACIIVEREFDPPLRQEQLDEVSERMTPCLDLYNVKWIKSYWSADRRRMICEYEAPDAEAVRNVQREAGALFDRVWLADVRSG